VESGTITSATKVFKYPRSTTSNHLYYRLVVTGSGGGGSVTPAVLGGSKPLPSSSDFKEFVFTATEITGRSYRVESTSDFKTWAEVSKGSVTGATMEFRFPRSTGTNNLYYRLVSLP
jgi:hypothetical protein